MTPNADYVGQAEDLLLMNDDATVTPLIRCRHCRFLFVDIDKHVRESVSVWGSGPPPNDSLRIDAPE
jgi:hypothetical protein